MASSTALVSNLRRLTACVGLLALLAPACVDDVHKVGEDDSDAGACSGAAPTCCTTGANGCTGPFGKATCSGGAWACADGEDPGGACPALCPGDAGGGDAASCAGDAPTCCAVDANGCSGPFGKATCNAGTWACADGEAPGGGCPTICAGDAAPGDAASCSGEAPTCCGVDAKGCSGPFGKATCDVEAGVWVCADGDAPGGGCTTICPGDAAAGG